ncbi:hypothetical protein K435DRAFT_811931 [Dendrothele bispora CBS 962.96]|uniref:Uncharacterized protein n=1 Tax=Dendrothele bispora (strain CBS 962.96) TaxID=1314807 RepID=A0A4S8KQY8_DENBC|nr:hypothetical protein K435DRAFT_811931 [Dendrothele bispora CBS 962.96]
MAWFYNSHELKSLADLDNLVPEVIQAEDFCKGDLESFSAKKVVKEMDELLGQSLISWQRTGSWIETLVEIPLLAEDVKQPKSTAPKLKSDPKLTEETDVENLPVGIMAWSDETQVTQFGDHLMWPIYLYLGNQSKYERAKPTLFSAHHVAYIPKLLSNVQDRYQNKIGFPASSATLTHLKRELIQVIWALILDPEFMHAYEHETVLLVDSFLASSPIQQTILRKTDQIGRLGTYLDCCWRQSKVQVDSENCQSMIQRIRRWIFDFGYRIASHAVEVFLQPFSYTPTVNTFSKHFYGFGVNFFLMFFPDVLLYYYDQKFGYVNRYRIFWSDQYMNWNLKYGGPSWYRQVPTFSHDTICKIRNNASSMKHLAARDFEGMLQVSIPVFEGKQLNWENLCEPLTVKFARSMTPGRFQKKQQLVVRETPKSEQGKWKG